MSTMASSWANTPFAPTHIVIAVNGVMLDLAKLYITPTHDRAQQKEASMSAQLQEFLTSEQYLAMERQSASKHEYYAGTVFAMAGASEAHNLIVINILASLHAQLRHRDCTVYPSDMRVKIPQIGLYTYPDVVVVCGQARFEDEHRDTLLNPVVIIEVLSPSTENCDRGKKFQHYRTINTLQEYILIAQDSYHLERYSRQSLFHWLFSEADGSESLVTLETIECNLLLADLYEKVTFEDS